MPNTLAHVGFQGLISRSLFRGIDIKWVCVGCVLPDIPWILQRLVRIAVPGVDLYDLRLYGIVQASLLFCLILGLAIAILTRRPGRVLRVLSFNALLHLLLDASQIKWATGVHFLAPFRWELTSFGFFWPESPVTYILTAIGLGLILVTWKTGFRTPAGFSRLTLRRISLASALVALYIFLPFSLVDGPFEADNHFIKTLHDYENRSGRYLEIDRKEYTRVEERTTLRTFANESLAVEGMELEGPAVVSIRGRFLTGNRVRIEEYHVHSRFRDIASYAGLSLIAILWLSALVNRGVRS